MKLSIKNIVLSCVSVMIMSTSSYAGWFSPDPVLTSDGLIKVKSVYNQLLENSSRVININDISCDGKNELLDQAFDSVKSSRSSTESHWIGMSQQELIADKSLDYTYIRAYRSLMADVFPDNRIVVSTGERLICSDDSTSSVRKLFNNLSYNKSLPLIIDRSRVIESKLRAFHTKYPSYVCKVVTKLELNRLTRHHMDTDGFTFIESDLSVSDKEFNDNIDRELWYCEDRVKTLLKYQREKVEKAKSRKARIKHDQEAKIAAEKSRERGHLRDTEKLVKLLLQKGATGGQIALFRSRYKTKYGDVYALTAVLPYESVDFFIDHLNQ